MVAPVSDPQPSTRHIGELDGFRGLSILAVLAAHMLPLGPKAWQLNAAAGYMGMSVFFCLSGFLITRFLWERPDVKVFVIRRFARILPLVLLVSTIYCLIVEFRPDTFVGANLYILNYWHSATSAATSPWWSLGVEMHFYLSIAMAVLILGRSGFWLVPFAAACVFVLRVQYGVFGAIPTHFRVDEILSGSMLALLWLNREDERLASIMRLLANAFYPLFFLWALSCWPPTEALGYFRPYFAAGMIGSVIAMGPGWQKYLLNTRALRYIALISFALYVWHSPFRHGWFNEGSDWERYLFKRPISFAAVFTLAHLSTFYFEKPITDAARRLTQLMKPKIA